MDRLFKATISFTFTFTFIALLVPGCVNKPPPAADYPVQPVSFTSVKLTDNFWAPRIKKIAEVTIPMTFDLCESTGHIQDMQISGETDSGKMQAINPFDNPDLFKLIEGASYSLQTFPDPVLETYLDTLIGKVAMVQGTKGHLYPGHTVESMKSDSALNYKTGNNKIAPDSAMRYELLKLGHLFDAAVAHYKVTGKRTLLEIAIKSADQVISNLSSERAKDYYGQPEIAMGLVKLYRITTGKKYLDLARAFMDSRSLSSPSGQTGCEGPSAGTTLLYSGMADIAALENDPYYIRSITKIWRDLVSGKMYITGGIGASGVNVEFSKPFVLPNLDADCQTCISIGNIFFNQRLFFLYGQAKYYDIIEKILYNSMLAGVSLSADNFSIINPLESTGKHKRIALYDCPSSLSDISGFIPSIPGYIYAIREKELYVNLFISNYAVINLDKRDVSVSLRSNFPWDGKVEMSVNPGTGKKFTIKIRIPGWSRDEAIPENLYKFADSYDKNVKLTVNGENTELMLRDGYAVLTRKWKDGDKIGIEFPMPVRIIAAAERVKEDAGKIAFQRGPVIFCAEWPDNNSGNIMNLIVNQDDPITSGYISTLLAGTQLIRTSGLQTRMTLKGEIEMFSKEQITLIPYAFWNNRGPGQMRVWLPTSPERAHPLPAPTIAFSSKIRASKMTKEISAINDQILPQNSSDNTVLHYDWWPEKNQWVWVEYDFKKPVTISNTKIYWYDDGPGGNYRVPDEWEFLYLDENIWKPVETKSGYGVVKDSWNSVVFKRVKTASVKIKVKLNRDFSGGIYEWVVQ